MTTDVDSGIHQGKTSKWSGWWKKNRRAQWTQKQRRQFYTSLCFLLLFSLWWLVTETGLIAPYFLPSPREVFQALLKDAALLWSHAKVTLTEAFLGLSLGISFGFVFAVLMLFWKPVYWLFYPILVLTQTIPTIAIAPLLVLWMGYGIAPKIVLIIIYTFFPITVGLYEGFTNVDNDQLRLFESMDASKWQIFRYLRFPSSLDQFFAALKISVSYALVGAVVSEWMGGYSGLGVYMTRVRKAFANDKMFAVIFLVSALSLLLMAVVVWIKKVSMPWKAIDNREETES